jgi:hypothetical protein
MRKNTLCLLRREITPDNGYGKNDNRKKKEYLYSVIYKEIYCVSKARALFEL